MGRKAIIGLGFFTLFGFSAIGAVILTFVLDVQVGAVFLHGWHWSLQLLAGTAYGLITGGLGWLIVSSKLMGDTRTFYIDMIKELELSTQDIIFISFCAGVGEEMLFRAALQPLVENWTSYHLGIWITSVFFVAIHGYLNPTNWRLSLYGLFMTLIIGGIGYLFHEAGLITVMTAHMVIDIVLLSAINNHKPKSAAAILEETHKDIT